MQAKVIKVIGYFGVVLGALIITGCGTNRCGVGSYCQPVYTVPVVTSGCGCAVGGYGCSCTDPSCGNNPCLSASKCCRYFGNIGLD